MKHQQPRTNLYTARCFYCPSVVPKGEGLCVRLARRGWKVWHTECRK